MPSIIRLACGLTALVLLLCRATPGQDIAVELEQSFEQHIQPLLAANCLRCHNAETMKSGIRLDRLNGQLEDAHLRLWNAVREQLVDEAMPPDDQPQPTAQQRQQMVDWIERATTFAKSRKQEKNGSVRRLTVAQYRNTLRDLLQLDDDFSDLLPADAVSKDGFLNNEQTMQLSPLLIEAYFKIGEQALDRCLVDEQTLPNIQNFRMDLGASINPQPYPEPLVLGALSHLLANQDFMVTQLRADKPFEFEPYWMQTKFRFIEGYQGNDTVREWRDFDSIYHAVFACMRGDEGYPKGRAYEAVPEGLLLRPAVPSAELFQVQSTYGPKANFKISLRELPDHGNFRVTVKAAKYDDGLLLDQDAPLHAAAADHRLTADVMTASPTELNVDAAGIYQVDAYYQPSDKPDSLTLTLGTRQFTMQLAAGNADQELGVALLLIRLPAGPLKLEARCGDSAQLRRVELARVADDSALAQRFQQFEQRWPQLGVHLGLRRDCGSTLTRVGKVQTVSSLDLQDYIFEGAISNFPNPDVERNNVNYLAGVREIGIRSEYTDGRDMPRLLIRSVEFEGPYYACWPPATHRNIFIPSTQQHDPPTHAGEIIGSFASRAFRRPVTAEEQSALMGVWQRSFAESGNFQRSVRDALLVVLTSPQFLFIIENSATPEPEPLDEYELASKLSYFLWNAAPDARQLQLAEAGQLHASLDAEIDRMMDDPQFEQFAQEFVTQWLSLDKLDVVEVDRDRYPALTRDVKTELRNEPVQFVKHLLRQNLPLRNLVQSDFIVANEVVAGYYGLGNQAHSGFDFVAISHSDPHLGGVLTQAGILAGLSNGRESNPVKRGAWLARKIIAEPPDDPPPNVPALPEDDGEQLTLREKLERHRNQEGCAKCHAGIDPWGLPLEQFDAGGLWKRDYTVDVSSTLPDKTEVTSADQLRAYLADQRIDQVAFSFYKHLAGYATGRQLSYNEIEFLREKGLELKARGYPMQDMLRFVIHSPLFLEK